MQIVIQFEHFCNGVNSFEVLPLISLALISCGSKSQKCALLLAMHDIVLYVTLQCNDMICRFLAVQGITSLTFVKLVY